MKFTSKITKYTQYYVLQNSMHELNNSLEDDSFVNIIQAAKPLLNTGIISVEEAEKIVENLPNKFLVFKVENFEDCFHCLDYFMCFSAKNEHKSEYYIYVHWDDYEGRRFCEFCLEKVQSLKSIYRKQMLIADERQQKLHDTMTNVVKTWRIRNNPGVKRKRLPIWAIHACFDNEGYENMYPICETEEYTQFVDTILPIIAELVPENEFDEVEKQLKRIQQQVGKQ